MHLWMMHPSVKSALTILLVVCRFFGYWSSLNYFFHCQSPLTYPVFLVSFSSPYSLPAFRILRSLFSSAWTMPSLSCTHWETWSACVCVCLCVCALKKLGDVKEREKKKKRERERGTNLCSLPCKAGVSPVVFRMYLHRIDDFPCSQSISSPFDVFHLALQPLRE